MLALPTYTPPHLYNRINDYCAQPPPLQLSQATMSFAAMPFIPPPTSKRPKLSLQTSMIPPQFRQQSTAAQNIVTPLDSTVARNTYANVFDASSSAISKPQSSSPQRLQSSNNSSPTISSLNQTSFLPYQTSYYLPASPHSILRNSPFPRRHTSTASSRVSKRIFPPVKRVSFCNRPVQVIPTNTVEDSECSESELREKRRCSISTEAGDCDDAANDVPSTPVQGRRNKRREWVWTLGRLDNILPGTNPSDSAKSLTLPNGNNDEASEIGNIVEVASSFARVDHEPTMKGYE